MFFTESGRSDIWGSTSRAGGKRRQGRDLTAPPHTLVFSPFCPPSPPRLLVCGGKLAGSTCAQSSASSAQVPKVPLWATNSHGLAAPASHTPSPCWHSLGANAVLMHETGITRAIFTAKLSALALPASLPLARQGNIPLRTRSWLLLKFEQCLHYTCIAPPPRGGRCWLACLTRRWPLRRARISITAER